MGPGEDRRGAELAPEAEDLLRAKRAEEAAPLAQAALRAELVVGALFLVAAVVLALALPGTTAWDAPTVLALVLAYAALSRVRFEIGAGATDPTLLVLVPLLFAAPAGWVPLLVCAGFVLGRLPDVVAGEVHPTRLLGALGSSWHAVGPAVVLAAHGPGAPDLGDWWIYLLALAAQFACDTFSGVTREWLALGLRPRLQLRFLAEVYALDALLAPVGLLGAIADEAEPGALLLAAPLVAVLALFARERQSRLGTALELSESRGEVLEAQLRAERGRLEVMGSLSHHLQTPLASVIGLSGALARRGDGEDPVAAQLQRDALRLGHLVRQVLDYQALQRGEALAVGPPAAVDVAQVAREVAAQLPGRVEVVDETAGRTVRTDRARVGQVLLALVHNAVAVAPPELPVVLRVAPTADGGIEVDVVDRGPGIPPEHRARLFAEQAVDRGRDESQGTGIGLHVAGTVAAALGGTLAATFPEDGGSVFSLALPSGDPGVHGEPGGRLDERGGVQGGPG